LTLWTTLPRLSIDGGGLVDELRQWADSSKEPKLIVLDTLACVRPTRSHKDNSYEADYAALSPLQRLAGELPLAIVVVHHLRKLESEDPLDAISGTTALTGAADSVLVLRRDARGVTLYGRGRDIDEIEEAMQFEPMTGHWTILGEVADVRKSEARWSIIDALRTEGEMSVNNLAAATGMERNNVDQLLHKMKQSGEVICARRGVYSLPSDSDKNDKKIRNATDSAPGHTTSYVLTDLIGSGTNNGEANESKNENREGREHDAR
jgi:biotin operon repressor